MESKEKSWRTKPPIREDEDRLIHRRLRAVYRFALKKIFFERGMKRVDQHLDVGTYKGTFVKELFYFANNVVSIDLDREKLREAKVRVDLQQFYPERLDFLQMKAQNIGLQSNFFDSASIIEVFGAGFEGTQEDVEQVIREVHRTLKPGGILIMTVRSASAEKAFEAIANLDNKGLPVSRKKLKPLIQELFGNNYEWYGQIVMKKHQKGKVRKFLERASKVTFNHRMNHYRESDNGILFPLFERFDDWLFASVREPFYGTSLPVTIYRDENNIGHPVWDPRSFEPRKAKDFDKEQSAYYVAVCQKPIEQNLTP